MTDQNEEIQTPVEPDLNEEVKAADESEAQSLEVVDKLIAERDLWRERALRATAEAENTRRRSEQSITEARVFAIQRFAKELMGVADNLERALQAAPDDADTMSAGLVTGLELTQKSLMTAFESNNLICVCPQPGDDFDPHLHQAMMEQPSDTIPGGQIIMTLQSGYALSGRTLRAAMVVVASKGSGLGYGRGANRTGENVDAKA